MEKDKKFTLRCSTQEVECSIEKIESKIDLLSLKIQTEKIENIGTNEAGVVCFKLKEPIVIEEGNEIYELCQITIEREKEVMGIGFTAI